MSDPFASPSPASEGHSVEPAEPLQFDQAEFETSAAERPTCVICKLPISEEYYEINGKLMCPLCRHGFEASFHGGPRLARFLRATVFGTVTAIVGAAIYYASVRITNLNMGIVSILVGFMVGSVVRKGSGNRGGNVYQLLAVFLTYSSIVAMQVPFLIEAIQHLPRQPVPQKAPAGKPDPAEAKGQAPGQAAANDQAGQPGAQPGGPRPGPQAPGAALSGLLLALVMMVGILYAMPLQIAMNAPISGLIYAFALWEAWKINRPIQLVFNGPFRLAEAGPAELEPEEIDDGV
jgi:hypothetical protein